MDIFIEGTANIELPSGKWITISSTELKYAGTTRTERQMDVEELHKYTYSDPDGNLLIWDIVEYPIGILDSVRHQLGEFQIHRDFHFTILDSDEFDSNYHQDLLDRFPQQEPGFNYGIKNGKVVYRPSYIDPTTAAALLHKSLLLSAESLQASHRTIGNKHPSLLQAIDLYFYAINKDISNVDAVEVYVAGLDFDTEYQMALKYSGDELEEYPELNKNENASILKVLRKHAAYIQSTPEGSYFTDAEERHIRSIIDEQKRIEELKKVAKTLLEHPDIIEPSSVQTILKLADPAPNDPNASRKKTVSKTGLRNFLIVVGIGTAISLGTGSLIGLAVSSVAGPVISTTVGSAATFGARWITKNIAQKTKAFKEFTDNSALAIDKWIDKEKPQLVKLANFFKDFWPVFRPTIDSPGLDQWFEDLHRAVQHKTHREQNRTDATTSDVSSPSKLEVPSTPKIMMTNEIRNWILQIAPKLISDFSAGKHVHLMLNPNTIREMEKFSERGQLSFKPTFGSANMGAGNRVGTAVEEKKRPYGQGQSFVLWLL